MPVARFLSVSYPLIVGRALKIPVSSQILSLLRPGIITILLFAGLTQAMAEVSAESWITLVFGVVATVVVLSAIAFCGGLSLVQQQRVLKRLKKVWVRDSRP